MTEVVAHPLIKICSKCSIERPLEEFQKAKKGLYGRRADCKFCRVGYKGTYVGIWGLREDQWPDHKVCTGCKLDKLLEDFLIDSTGRGLYNRVAQCGPCRTLRTLEWRADNRDQYNANQRRWRAESPTARENATRYYQENKEQYQAWHAEWKKNNKEAVARYSRNRYELLAALDEHHTEEEWLGLCESCHYTCMCCEDPERSLTADHIIPLSMGGLDTIDNIQPLCQSCNSTKHMKTINYRPTEETHELSE